jgi:hypothetical protein
MAGPPYGRADLFCGVYNSGNREENMDTLPVIIVTAVVTAFINGAVSVAIFRRVEENIKLEFSEQLERFRTDLQKEVVEHQVKFSRNYPRMVETLENFINRFHEHSSLFRDYSVEIIARAGGVYDLSTIDKVDILKNELDKKLSECFTYLSDNSIHLPDTAVIEFVDALHKSREIDSAMSGWGYFMMRHAGFPPDWLKLEIGLTGLSAKIDPTDTNAAETFMFELQRETDAQLERVEKLYKTLAETQ